MNSELHNSAASDAIDALASLVATVACGITGKLCFTVCGARLHGQLIASFCPQKVDFFAYKLPTLAINIIALDLVAEAMNGGNSSNYGDLFGE